MKKLLIITIIAFNAMSIFAQQGDYGSWIYSDGTKYRMMGQSHFAPKLSIIPPTIDIGTDGNPEPWTMIPKIHKGMSTVFEALKETYPKPYKHSFLTDFHAQPWQGNNRIPKAERDKKAWAYLNVFGAAFDY
jgi:hypothetical protein